MNKHDIIKQRAVNDLLNSGWTNKHTQMQHLDRAENLEDVWYALYYVAEHIGQNKGWGEEGIGELHNELVEKYWGEFEIEEF